MLTLLDMRLAAFARTVSTRLAEALPRLIAAAFLLALIREGNATLFTRPLIVRARAWDIPNVLAVSSKESGPVLIMNRLGCAMHGS